MKHGANSAAIMGFLLIAWIFLFGFNELYSGRTKMVSAGPQENIGPALMLGSVSPEKGRVGSSFTFQVVYIHPENVPPIYVYLKLDNFIFPEEILMENYITFSMNFVGGNYTTGATYAFTWKVFEEYIGLHVYYFEAMVGNLILRFPENGVLFGPTVLGFENNQPPILSGSVAPLEGVAGTVFEYSAIYWDNEWDPPAFVNVYIDGVPHHMESLGGSYENGLIFAYLWSTTAADAGTHHYYFEAGDGIDNVRFPENGFLDGPVVTEPPPAEPNRPPSLKQGIVFPESGEVGERFTFEIIYSDPDGDEPVRIEAVVDNVRYGMQKVTGNPENGELYRYVCEGLSQGTHFYYFESSDDHETVRYPKTGVLIGPIVVESRSVSSYLALVAVLGTITFLTLVCLVFYILRRKYSKARG